MTEKQAQVVLEVRHISKRFGVTQALDDVSVSFHAGQVHALMGENGAGKSTLGKVIAGLHRPDDGQVHIRSGGRALAADEGFRMLAPGDMEGAFAAGVRIVHQELAQCPNLSVAENLCLHDLPRGRLGMVDRAAINERAARLLADLEPSIDVSAPLGELSPGHRQIVQIASALDDGASGSAGDQEGDGAGARVIVFDEPTSSLSIAEVDRLLRIVRELAARGLAIVYVSHRMGEIFAACDRVTVLRDGRYVATSEVAAIDEPALVEQMIGRRLPAQARRAALDGSGGEASAIHAIAEENGHGRRVGDVLLEVRGLSSPGRVRDVSLAVRAGEVLGIGGLVGAGRSELLDAIFGLDARASGTVTVGGEVIPRGDPRAMIRAGVGYVPEDRKLQGLFFQLGVDENILVPYMPRLARFWAGWGVRNRAAERAHVRERIGTFQIKAASPSATPDALSGGNQQKLLIARWMGESTRVLLLDEPTRGIDVGTKAEIYRLVRHAADAGAAVVLVSSEMPELLALSDRVAVMCGGHITGELRNEEMTQAGILRLATAE